MDRISLSEAVKEMELLDRRGSHKSFSFTYAKKNGMLSTYLNATLSSIHSKGSTVNIMLEGEDKPKTFRKICFTRFNNKRIYI